MILVIETRPTVYMYMQDMKCCGMWYLEAIRKLKLAGESLERTVHVVFVPGNKQITLPRSP